MRCLNVKVNVVVFTIFVLISDIAASQSKKLGNKEIEPLKIGEKVPDIDLGKIYGDSLIPDRKNVNVSTYKGKLLLLDFWGITCGDCIAAFPKIERLREQFGNAVEILPVGFSSTHRDVYKRLQEWKGTSREMKIPTTILDDTKPEHTLMRKYFPHTGAPTIVWIDTNGHFIAITDQYAVTEKNIQSLLNGTKLPFKVKRTWSRYEANDASNEPFLVSKNPKIKIKSASILSNYIDTLNSLYGLQEFRTDSNYYRLVGVNKTFFELIRSAYSQLSEDNEQLLRGNVGVKKVLDKSKKQFKDRYEVRYADNWERYDFEDKHLFNYELMISKNDIHRKDLFGYAIRDMERFFDVKTSIERRKIKCFAVKLKPNGITALTQTLREKPKNLPGIDNKGTYYLEKMTLDQMIAVLNTSTPFRNLIINQTNYKGELSFLYPSSMLHDISSVRSFLNSYGLQLVEVEREMEVLVIKDAK